MFYGNLIPGCPGRNVEALAFVQAEAPWTTWTAEEVCKFACAILLSADREAHGVTLALARAAAQKRDLSAKSAALLANALARAPSSTAQASNEVPVASLITESELSDIIRERAISLANLIF